MLSIVTLTALAPGCQNDAKPASTAPPLRLQDIALGKETVVQQNCRVEQVTRLGRIPNDKTILNTLTSG
jgi:hypothetical protein